MNKRLTILNGMMITLATIGIIFPQMQILGSEQRPNQPAIKVVPANSILDVALAKDGEFSGRVVDQTGSPIHGAMVNVKSDHKVDVQVRSDQSGRFSVPNLKSGVYQVSSGQTSGFYRLWSERTAPPSARPFGLLVLGENGTRGQIGSFGPRGLMLATGAVLVAVAVTAAVTANQARNVHDDDTLCVSP